VILSLILIGPKITALAPNEQFFPIINEFGSHFSFIPITFPPVNDIFSPIFACPEITIPIEGCKIAIPPFMSA